MKVSILFIFSFFVLRLAAQPLTNSQLLSRVEFKQPAFEQQANRPTYTFKNKKWYVKYNPVSLFFGGALLFYQRKISPQIAASCNHEVSCSNFSKQVIQQYGLMKGVFLTADRLARCGKLGMTDVDRISGIRKETGKVIDEPGWYKLKDKEHTDQ